MKLIKLIFAMSVGVFVSWTITSCEIKIMNFLIMRVALQSILQPSIR